MAKSKSERKKTFYIFLGITTIAFATLTVLAKLYPYLSVDLKITMALQSIHNSFFAQSMWFLTQLGNYPEALILPIAFSLIFFWKKQKKEGILLILSSYSAVWVSELLKRIVARPRP